MGILQGVCQPQPPNGGYDEDIFIITPPDSLKCPVCLLVVRNPYLLSCCGVLICQVCFRVVRCFNFLLTLTHEFGTKSCYNEELTSCEVHV